MPAPISAASIDALVSVDPRVLDAAGLKHHLIELAAARSKLAAAEAAAVSEFDHRGCCVEDGMVNVRSWLAHHTGVPRAVAGGRVLLAKRLRRMPAMAEAFASGVVTETHARAMTRCLTPRTVVAFERDEQLLVTKAKELEAADFARQRRALIARDRGCIVPGCKRKPRWCDAHHVLPSPSGPTNLANLVLLCKRHHRQVHAGAVMLLPDHGLGWIVARPDGTPLRQRPPPHLAA